MRESLIYIKGSLRVPAYAISTMNRLLRFIHFQPHEDC